ncbi:hypothetical protein EII99_23895, partial [Xanthomonas perforans]
PGRQTAGATGAGVCGRETGIGSGEVVLGARDSGFGNRDSQSRGGVSCGAGCWPPAWLWVQGWGRGSVAAAGSFAGWAGWGARGVRR